MALARALGSVTLVVLARGLEPQEFATYLVVATAAILAIPVADGGFFALVFRQAARADYALFALSRTADRIRTPIWMLLVGVPAILAAFGVSYAALLSIALAGAIAHAQSESMLAELQAKEMYREAAAMRILAGATGAAGAAVVTAISPTAASAVLGFTVARVVPVFVYRLRFRQPEQHQRARINLSYRNALPFGATALVTVAYVRSDVLLLASFGAPAAVVGGYGATYSLLLALQLIPSAILTAAYPRISAVGSADAPSLVAATTAVTVAASAVGCAACLLFTEQALGMFGSLYAEQADTLRPLIAAAMVIALGQVLIASLQARDGERYALRVVGAAFVVNVALNVTLIPKLGVTGAIVATLAAESVVVVAAARYLQLVRRIDVRGATVVMIAAPWLALISPPAVATTAIIAAASAYYVLVRRLSARSVYDVAVERPADT